MTMDLQPGEAKLIELIRSMPADAAREVADFATFKAARTATWTYDDPSSCAAAWERAISDPTFAKEIKAIEKEFAVAEADGLDEDY
jgi:hypothetical protein